MKMWVKKMNKHGMHLLHAGETVETAVPSQATGSMNSQVGRQVGGLVGAAVSAAINKKNAAPEQQAGGLADSVPSGDAVYVITDQRLAAISYTVLGGKPDELVASYDYRDIAGVEAKKGRMASTVSLSFNDGSVAAFEVPRMAKPERFVEALQAKVA